MREPAAVYKTITNKNVVSFNDAEARYMDITTEINPVQDLNGYNAPWSAGGGYNKFDINSAYSDTSKFTINGLKVVGTPPNFNSNKIYIPTHLEGKRLYFSAIISPGHSANNVRVAANVNGNVYKGTPIPANSTGKSVVTFVPSSSFDYIYFEYDYFASGTMTISEVQLTVDEEQTLYYPYSNVCPIEGSTSINIVVSNKNLASFINGKGLDSSGNVVDDADKCGMVNPVYIKTGYSYVFTSQGDAKGTIAVWKVNRLVNLSTNISSGTTIPTYDGDRFYVCIYKTGGSATKNANKPMIRFHNASSDYVEFEGGTNKRNLPNAAGTVYGGDVKIGKDESCVLHVDRSIITYSSSTGFVESNGRWYKNELPDGIDTDRLNESISNQAKYLNDQSMNGSLFCFDSTGIYINKINSEESLYDLNIRLSNIPFVVCYCLATPVEYNFTVVAGISANPNENNILSNTGKITELTYQKDIDTVKTECWNAIYSGKPSHAKVDFYTQNKIFTDQHINIHGGISIHSIGNPDNQMRISKSVMNEVIINFIYSDAFDDLDWSEEFKLYFGVDTEDGTIWTDMGYYLGQKPKINVIHKTITLTAYDRMGRFDVIADDFLSHAGTNMLGQLYVGLCQYVGLQGHYDFIELGGIFANRIEGVTFKKGITCRALLDIIAECVGHMAEIGSDGAVYLFSKRDVSTLTSIINKDDCFDIETDPVKVALKDCVYAASSEDSNNGYLYPTTGSNPYVIIDNPILLGVETSLREAMMGMIATYLGLIGEYYPGTLECVGNWFIDYGDGVAVAYDGKIYGGTIFNRTLYWNGHCTDEYEFVGSNDEDDYYTPAVKEQYSSGGKFAEKQNKIDNDLQTTTKTVVGAINELNTAVGNLDNAGIDVSFTIAASDWSVSAPYTYTWLNQYVTPQCVVEVEFDDDVTGEIPYLSYEKTTGGILFTAPSLPTVGIPVNVHITNVQESAVTSVSGDMVSTDVITGASNVDEALTVVKNKIGEFGFIITYAIPANVSSYSITLEQKKIYFLALCSSVDESCGAWIIRTTASGMKAIQIFKGQDASVSNSGLQLTITKNNAYLCEVVIYEIANRDI